jgi:hypothetical protein
MEGSSKYVVAGRAVATYEALAAVVRERLLVTVQADVRHLTLAFRPDGEGWSEHVAVLCAVLDAGHGLSKLVLVGVDQRDGGTVGLAGYPASLFAEVEQRLGSEERDRVGGVLARP